MVCNQLTLRMATSYRLDASIGYLLNRASRAIHKRFNARLVEANYAITGEQWAVLVHLWEQDGRPQRELAEILGKDKTTITRLVHDLEKRNLAVRVPGKADRRQKLVHLTPYAQSIEKPVKAIAQAVLLEAQAGLTDAEVAIAKKVMRHIETQLALDS